METLGKLRRRHLVKGESISAIARDTHLSRQTVRKYLAARDEPRYIRKHQPFPQLGPFRETLTAWLEGDRQRPVRERRTAMRLFNALRQEGYRGGYDSVRRFVKRWKKSQRPAVTQAFVPLAFAPGAKYQFDWSHEVVELGGVLQTVKVAHFRLCYSRRSFVAAYPRETQEMVFDAHNRAFAAWGGVPLAGIYDNPKTVVDVILAGKARQFNRRFLALMNHYLIEPIACTPAAGWEKGQVENQVGTLRDWLFTPRLQFACWEDLNVWLARRCQELEQRPHPDQLDRTIGELFAEERAQLRPFTAAFDGYVEHTVRASSTCLVNYDRNRYSVPAAYAGKLVSVRAYAERIQVVADEPTPGRASPLLWARPIALQSLALPAGAGAQTRRLARWRAVSAVGVTGGLSVRLRAVDETTRGRHRLRRPAPGRTPARVGAAGGRLCLGLGAGDGQRPGRLESASPVTLAAPAGHAADPGALTPDPGARRQLRAL